jgi:hypothetical protein
VRNQRSEFDALVHRRQRDDLKFAPKLERAAGDPDGCFELDHR